MRYLTIILVIGFLSVSADAARGDAAKLCEAAKAGDVAAINAALAAGADINTSDQPNGKTPLNYAIRFGKVDAVKALLAAGADINAEGPKGVLPLRMAAAHDQVEVIEILLKAKVDPNAFQAPGRPAITEAAASGSLRALELLLKVGANLEALDEYGNTPLIVASGCGETKSIERLLKAGADIRAVNSYGIGVLTAAAIEGKTPSAKVLLEAGADPSENNGRRSAVGQAARKGNTELVLLLVDHGAPMADPALVDEDPLLAIAAETLNEPLVKALVDRKAPYNLKRNQDPLSANALSTTEPSGLSVAAIAGKATIVDLLLANGARASRQNLPKTLPEVCDAGFGEVAAKLLDAWQQERPKEKQYAEMPRVLALLRATSVGDVDAVRQSLGGQPLEAFYIDLAAKVAKSKNKQDVIDALAVPAKASAKLQEDTQKLFDQLLGACEKGDAQAVKTLLSQGALVKLYDQETGETALLRSIAGKKLDCVKVLVEAGADLNEHHGYADQPPLRLAAMIGADDILKYLIEKGADPNTPGVRSKPLLLAAGGDSLTAIQILLDAEADVNAVGVAHRTPLMMAAEHGNLQIVKLLIQRGADVSLKDETGLTAADLARVGGHDQIVKALNEKPGNIAPGDAARLASLQRAIDQGPDALKTALQRGVDVNQPIAGLNMSPLEYAIAAPGLKDDARLKVVELLFEFGAEFDKKGDILTDAIYNMSVHSSKDTRIIKLLIKNGADVNSHTGWEKNYTPLMMATERNQLESVRVLLASGADRSLRLADGRTAADIAREKKLDDIEALLKASPK